MVVGLFCWFVEFECFGCFGVGVCVVIVIVGEVFVNDDVFIVGVEDGCCVVG